MSVARIIAVGAIYLLACAGWGVLGTATQVRSTGFSTKLRESVSQLYGTDLVQEAPRFQIRIPGTEDTRRVIPKETAITAAVDSDIRKKGLLYYPTFNNRFDATYTLDNAEQVLKKVYVHFAFPVPNATYNNFTFKIDDEERQVEKDTEKGISEIVEVPAGGQRTINISYDVRGMSTWRYVPAPDGGEVGKLSLDVLTNFDDIDYPEGTRSAMTAAPRKDSQGMQLSWRDSNMITRQALGVVAPGKLNPGPVTSRITFFAPVCLIFFFVLIGTINIIYKVDIHPMHYFFVAAGFFAFHLLLSYLVGLLSMQTAFAVSAITSVVMVTAYLRVALKRKLPWLYTALGQLFFLVVFSYSFLFNGFTGITVAIASVATLGILMAVTAHTDWNEVFKRPPKPPRIPTKKSKLDGGLSAGAC